MEISKKTDEYKAHILDRWHTPGHKGILWQDDISEIGGGKIFPGDSIAVAQREAAELYKASELRFLTGGSSMGIKAAILAAGVNILAGENAHQSVFEGAALARVKVVTVKNKEKDGLPEQLCAKDIAKALKDNPDIGAVVITSPDYFGRVCEPEVIDTVKKHGKLLIADSAHGAHFALRPDLFPPSLTGAADFCNVSAHKTLCALTMGAYLCINNPDYFAKTDEALKNLGTTSPLYPLLASLEKAIEIGKMQMRGYDMLKIALACLSREVRTLKNDDFTRVVVDASDLGFTGKQLYDNLYDLKIAAEMYTDRYVVFIATPFDDENKIFRLTSALKNLKAKRKGKR